MVRNGVFIYLYMRSAIAYQSDVWSDVYVSLAVNHSYLKVPHFPADNDDDSNSVCSNLKWKSFQHNSHQYHGRVTPLY